jgi:hypothetical protein
LLKDFGGKLYNALFNGELRDLLLRSVNQTRAQRVGMRLRFRLTDVPELAKLPWEFLYDRRLDRFMAQSRYTPLVRYLDLPDPPHPLSVDSPLRLLVLISNPRGWPRLDVDREWSVLTGALAQPQADGRVIIERMPANMSTLRQRLRREEFHIFHFVGHGYYRGDWGDGVLVMEDAEGESHEVTGEQLGGLLNEYDATRLAVLNACEGAISDASDAFAGMAQSLIQQGLPAVVAMQFEITDEAAIIFARELYGAIADGFQLEAALADARGAIRDAGNPTEWGTPVLYSRAPDGRLFDLARQSRISEPDRRVRYEADSDLLTGVLPKSYAPAPSTETAEPTLTLVTPSSAAEPAKSSKPAFPVYTDADATTNHYAPSGYMGDTGDISMEGAYKAVAHSGTTSIRVTYTAKGSGPNECAYHPPCKWAGVYWQEPPNNWGTNAAWAYRGYDLSGYRSLLFWARADEPTTIDFQVGGIDNPYGDSLKSPRIISARLDSQWHEYRIDLDHADLRHIIGGFAWVTNWDTNPDGCTFYLDDIRFE